ncbi:lethal(1)discs large-1 tumor suppressor [Salpingoeca rosetta]|uniref:Lethal(1)discs large-1 tumor suppressor n=1 Tax=Salpingoeca rosetta (strain ATCC 50818 / BSB-021) TaxID=946362 RepID=F2U0X6_SALR5|nr:lethal(1)discs large-1 tumor suppressor [Salpingoeca rosetta]EGD80550.1 lethal(1)discs large-1 tumor suppressor [Salpingoeca rosetta]|eukprot:XP_004997111.1 lethal(1)discs large-1 tumor suppressor [Salpingoeca rosetta]
MAVKKSEAYEALQQLTRLRNATEDESLIEDIDRLTSVMKSKLFIALLEVQDMFEQRFVSGTPGTSAMGSASTQQQRAGRGPSGPSRADLEWEDAFDFGSEGARNDQDGDITSPEFVEEIEEVNLVYGPSGIGISIAGGIDRPFLDNDTSIFVTGLVPGGAAEANGRIFAGDMIMSINGESCENRQHHEIVQMLRNTDNLQIVHHPQQAPPEPTPIDLQRLNGGLGFTIAGGKDTPHVAGDDGIFITKIIDGGAADEDGRLAVGDKIVSVGGKSIVGWKHDDVVQELQASPQVVQLGIEKNAYNKAAEGLSQSLGFKDNPPAKFSKSGTLLSLGTTKPEDGSLPASSAVLRTDHPSRTVHVHPSAKGSLGMAIVGPSSARPTGDNEPSGVFISSITEGGPAQATGDLFEGDQVLSVNGIDMTNATYVQATDIIRANCKSALELVVRANPDVYALYKAKMAKLQKRFVDDRKQRTRNTMPDSICVRALFDYDPGSDTGLTTKEKKKKLLQVHLNDVFIMIEWKANKDWWEVENVNNNDRGWVPSPHRCARSDAAKGGLKKRSRSFRFARCVLCLRLSFSRRRKSKTPTPVTCYEIVEQHQQTPDVIRPVILLGPSKDELTDMLFAEFPELFGSCVPHTTRPPREGEVHGEDYLFTTQEKMAAGIEAGDFIEAGQYLNHLYGTSFASLQDVIREGRVCILDVSAHAIEHLKRKDIHPIVVFVKPASLSVVKQQNPQLDESTARTVFDLADECVFKDFRHQFTQVVVNQDMSQTYHRVVQTIRRQSKEPYWAAAKDQAQLASFVA